MFEKIFGLTKAIDIWRVRHTKDIRNVYRVPNTVRVERSRKFMGSQLWEEKEHHDKKDMERKPRGKKIA